MKTIIAGSRNIIDLHLVYVAIGRSGFKITTLISGCARGVDETAEKWAEQHGIPIMRFTADWEKHGKRAGPIRNSEMAEHAEALIAIWDGVSRGTLNMIQTATKKGLKISVFNLLHETFPK